MLLAALRRAVPLPRIESFERCLFVGPHPDDVEMGCAPTLIKLARAGKETRIVVATDGSMGARDADGAGPELAARRRLEAQASARLLGAADPVFLPFTDGGLYGVEELAGALATEMVKTRPQLVFAPDPDLASECHMDHLKTGLAVKMAMFMAPFPAMMRRLGVEGSWQPEALAFYYTDRPNSYVSITARDLRLQAEALRLHQSQFDSEALDMLDRYLRLQALHLGLRRLRGPCNGFRVLGKLHMHCFPEVMYF